MKLLKLNILFFGIVVLFTTLILFMTQNIVEIILACLVFYISLVPIYFVYFFLLNEDLQFKTFVLFLLWIITLQVTFFLASSKIWIIVSSIPFACLFIFDSIRKIKNFIISNKTHIIIFQLFLVAIYCVAVLYFCDTKKQMIYMFAFGIFIMLFYFVILFISEALKQNYLYKNKRKGKKSIFNNIDLASYQMGQMTRH